MQRAMRTDESSAEIFGADPGVTLCLLRLYVAGSNLKSAHAIQIARKLCALFPDGRCKLEVIDLYQQPELARQDNVIGIPTLVRVSPPPRRAFVGMTEDLGRILQKLGITMVEYDDSKTKRR
jgi:circadian clock protein KaiB